MKVKIKDEVKAKAAAVKAKAKAKCKGNACKACAALALLALVAGCMDTNPASRATSNAIGDLEPTVKICIGENACSNAISVVIRNTFGDGAIASADSAGSTETQTATPSMSIPVRIDARYNDAIAAATPAAVLGSLGEGLGAVLDMMVSKKTGTVAAKTKDGKDVTVKCENGQCSVCEDCEL